MCALSFLVCARLMNCARLHSLEGTLMHTLSKAIVSTCLPWTSFYKNNITFHHDLKTNSLSTNHTLHTKLAINTLMYAPSCSPCSASMSWPTYWCDKCFATSDSNHFTETSDLLVHKILTDLFTTNRKLDFNAGHELRHRLCDFSDLKGKLIGRRKTEALKIGMGKSSFNFHQSKRFLCNDEKNVQRNSADIFVPAHKCEDLLRSKTIHCNSLKDSGARVAHWLSRWLSTGGSWVRLPR